ncbi:hypothetical protein KC19_5G199600 [Ceratodon purpureus]|uniref:Bromo domain-containing protein n=1 Tax=Ceratodon purpureus TaxID=3225 RepID=A0A8T0I6J5_CERPU|nr:hypothetical protein KC19_5G199600 [Ceratodon purpureus]
MADKDKKLRVILKLPSKSSNNSKAGISGTSASPGVTSHKVHASSVAGSGTQSKPSAQVAASTANNRVATPPKKRKFKTLVEGDAKDVQGGVYGTTITTVTAPPVFKAPLPPLAKKSTNKKKEKPLNGEIGVPLSSPVGKGQGGTPGPAKKVLEGVLDKLKKKDTYGVFSEPVDATMVPDYYDVIKEPMDFGTMYKKISKGIYYTLSLFEKDIMLICNNAMRYNGPDTIYYKQARSIQDAARKALDVVASQIGAPEAGTAKPVLPKKQPFPTKKGWKNTAAVKTLLEPASSDFASGASLAAEGDDVPQSIKHDTLTSKRGAPSDRSGSVAGEEPGFGAQSHAAAGLEADADVQDELGGHLRPATLKDGRRPLSNDEYHRSTYKPRNLPAHGRGPPLAGVGGELHHLVPTGYQSEMAYARSLSRFSVKLGPEGWKFAAQRLQRVVPLSVPFGQGWIGENEAPPGTIFRKFPDVKATNATRINQNLTSTASPSLPGVSSTSHSPVTTASFVPTPQMSRPLMINPAAQTTMDSLLTTVTSAMLASGVGSQALLSGKSAMQEPTTEKLVEQVQLEHSRGQGMPTNSDGLSTSTGRPLWSSQAPASQSAVPTSGMIMQTTSDSANGALSRWTGSTSQAAPTFVYSTAVRTVPTSASVSTVQDEASKAQAHNLELLQADALARAKMQSNVNLTQAPRPTQYMQQSMYTNLPPYGMPPGSLVRAPFGANQMLASSQPLPTSKHEVRPLKLAASQPLQLQMGALGNYGLSHSRPLSDPTSAVQQIHSSKPPPDLNLQPVDSPSTPQTTSQLNSLGTPQSSLSLQM